MVLALCIPHMYTDAVSIRIGGKNQVGADLFRQLKTEFKRLWRLGIRIPDCREITVRQLLLGNDRDMFEAGIPQNALYREIACAVERCVNDLQVIRYRIDGILVNDQIHHALVIRRIDIRADHGAKSLVLSLFTRHAQDVMVIDCQNIIHNTGIMRRCDLRAVFPVDLVPVVLRRVVTRRDIDAGDTAEMADSKRQLRCRSE